MTERTPLLHYRLSTSVNESEPRSPPLGQAVVQHQGGPRQKSTHQRPPKKLSVFIGVVIPTLLSMFSVVVFLRIDMISRALGPEFGGSIGLMFFLANVCGSALFVLGLVEAIVATFGVPEDGSAITYAYQVLPSGYWWSLLYATGISLLCLLVCLVGADIYAKATFLIFLVVMFVLGTIFVSFFAVHPRTIVLPISAAFNPTANGTGPGFPTTANFTGFKLDTLLGNLWGDLKNPSYAIPRGTITAVIFTFIIYNLLSVLVACSCDRHKRIFCFTAISTTNKMKLI
ncbi:hypothetical protein FQN60_004560 [Etheostoma spectabile]|uniref:Amino acid permease/ SLC12A domain-containing protein n=1 Tax=Etheostoma spectabile TaxID=54343 RepID=A0A5J5DJZ0_9PERO|nr:hypothetical protein FQN60_004560 [Etheostoma spectabile]